MTRLSSLSAASLLPRARSTAARAARLAERLCVSATRAVRRAPELTVLIDGDADSAPVAVYGRAEVRRGPLTQTLAAARGRWVVAVPAGTAVSPEFTAAMVRGAIRRTAVVPVGPGKHPDGAPRMTAAVMTAGTAFPRAAARAAGFSGRGEGAIVLHRARAMAALNRGPVIVRTTAPRVEPEQGEAAASALLDAATRVAAVSGRGPRVRRALQPVATALVGAAGAAVRTDPAARARLAPRVDAAADLDLADFNAGAARALAVLYAFPPALDTGGFVTARRMAARGEAYDAVTQEMGKARPSDDRSLQLARHDLGRRLVTTGPVSAGAWPGIGEYCRRGMAMIEQREHERGAYFSLYSRSMWVAPSVLAAWYKVRHPDVPWTAELSDPLSLRTNGERRPDLLAEDPILTEIANEIAARGLAPAPTELFFDAVEWMIYALADEIVFTNAHQRDLMLGAFPNAELAERARERSRIEPHPVPAPEFYEIGRSVLDESADAVAARGVTVGYFGTFYDVRGASDLLDPLAELSAEERAQITLLIFTAQAAKVRTEVEAHVAGDRVRVFDALGYFDFLATARALDWLVVADAHRPETFPVNPYLPSKYADYRGAGAKIWGMVEPGSTLSAEPLDASSPVGDVAAAADVLRRIVAERESS